MKTDPESRMYQHVPMSSGLKEREKEGKTKKLNLESNRKQNMLMSNMWSGLLYG